jgi:hypothetical protein
MKSAVKSEKFTNAALAVAAKCGTVEERAGAGAGAGAPLIRLMT